MIMIHFKWFQEIDSLLWNTNWKEVLKFKGRNLDPRPGPPPTDVTDIYSMTPCTQWPRDPMYLMTSFTCWTVWWGITDVTDKYMRHHRRDGQVHEASPTWRTGIWGITDVTDKYMTLSIASDNSYFVFRILIPKGLRWQAFFTVL